eukprot:TRINITY_DN710_c0_g1_i5.p5 TRINITY_DN710_c0_g1~~TRINITY_DN710_c0_g1_i5.p5  ORF type:complete len:130 (+),score=25.63 TRINITY_DN710_c0_g1_i5:135-524(+)
MVRGTVVRFLIGATGGYYVTGVATASGVRAQAAELVDRLSSGPTSAGPSAHTSTDADDTAVKQRFELVPPPPSGVTAEEAFRREVLTNVNTTIDAVAVRVMTLPATLKLIAHDARSLLPGGGSKQTPDQ